MAGIIYTPPPTAPTPPTPPGGNANSIQFNGGGIFKGLDFLEADAAEEHAQFIADNTVNTPPQGKAVLYANSDDGDEPLTVINSWGKNIPIQYNIGHKIIGMIWPSNGGSPNNAFSFSGRTTAVGATWSDSTALAQKNYVAGTSLQNFTRMNGASAAALNSSAEVYVNTKERGAVLGSASQAWGTKLIITFGLPTYKSDQRFFAGYSTATAQLPANADPSTFLNAIGLIKDSGGGNFVFYVRGAGLATSVNTGVTPTLNSVYRFTIFIPSSGGRVYMNLQEILVGSVTSTNYNTNASLPVVGSVFVPHLMVNTGATTATAVNISLIQVYEEQL